MFASVSSLQPHLLSLLRIVSALVLFSYGTQKILHFPAAERVPEAGSLPWIAGMFELILGFLVLIGFKTRIAAFVLSGVMAFAYFISHAPSGFYPADQTDFTQAPLRFDDATQASTKATPFTPSSTVG
jgi:putative oxidoreductase